MFYFKTSQLLTFKYQNPNYFQFTSSIFISAMTLNYKKPIYSSKLRESRNVYAYFNNDINTFAVDNAKTLIKMCAGKKRDACSGSSRTKKLPPVKNPPVD